TSYLFGAGFGLLVAVRGDAYHGWSPRRKIELCIAAVATFYAFMMIIAGGLDYFVLSSLIYAPGTILFIIARRDEKGAVFAHFEWAVLGIILVGVVVGLWQIATQGSVLGNA